MAILYMRYVEQIRKDVAEQSTANPSRKFFVSHPVEYGEIRIMPATGRALCRVCAERIAKGEEAITFYWDFADGGSYTCTKVWIHKACSSDTVKLDRTPRRIKEKW